MATTETFKFKNIPNEIIEESKEWIIFNPHIARRTPEESDFYKVEVFGYDHAKVAKDLHKALKKSGFLNKYPLFCIKIEPM